MPNPEVTIRIAHRATLSQHGELTQYTAGDQVRTPTGKFDAAYQRVQSGKAGMQSAAPAVFYRLEDLPSDPQEVEPSIVIRGVTYTVAEVKKDGQGGVLLHLHRS